MTTRELIQIKPSETDVVKNLASALSVSEVLATILVNRGLKTYEQCREFFRPDLSMLHDPFLFNGMEAACGRILKAIKGKEKIVVYGDYDVDGVTATALVIEILRYMEADCSYYLPNRLTHGYGISMEVMQELKKQGTQLVITVDCGITACEEVAWAMGNGMDVIVTDHHEPKENIPQACALLNPKLENCEYPDKLLAGVGVAFKLCLGLLSAAGLDKELGYRYLDLVALGTAADIVPLLGENRIIAAKGFSLLRNTQNPGLQELINVQGLAGRHISTTEVVFQLAPCINAAGRLGDPSRGVELLLSRDPALIKLYAQELREANHERRVLDQNVQQQVFDWVDSNCDLSQDFVVVTGDRSWHCGVIGIVASKVVERYHRPALLFSIGDDGMARGSGRSIHGLHLTETLQECAHVLESFGGHAAAAGASIREENIDEFRRCFNRAVKARVSENQLVPRISADVEIPLEHITPNFFSLLKQMEPFGPGNMRPVFYTRNLHHRYAPRIVGQKHVKMNVAGARTSMNAIAFGFGERFEEISASEDFALAFSIEENEWNGTTSLQMKIKGVEL